MILLQIRKKIVRHEIKQRILPGTDRNELMMLRFTKEESEKKLKWEEPGEFEYDGEMYDVVFSESDGITVSYW